MCYAVPPETAYLIAILGIDGDSATSNCFSAKTSQLRNACVVQSLEGFVGLEGTVRANCWHKES